jgi:hypothetical protein
MWYINRRIYFSLKNGENSDIGNKMDEH